MLKKLNSCRRYEYEAKATGCGQDVCAYGYVLPEKFIFVTRDVWGGWAPRFAVWEDCIGKCEECLGQWGADSESLVRRVVTDPQAIVSFTGARPLSVGGTWRGWG